MNGDPKLKRHVRLLTIDSNRVLGILARKQTKLPQCLLVEEFDLPNDCVVRSVYQDYARGAFVFVIQSSEFDEVEECVVPPDHPVTSRVVEIAIKQEEEPTNG